MQAFFDYAVPILRYRRYDLIGFHWKYSGSTEPSVLIFITFLFAIFMIVLIWIIEAIFYAVDKRQGFYGVNKWKNKK